MMTESKQTAIPFGPNGHLPFGGQYANTALSFHVELQKYFEHIDIESPYLRNLLIRALWKIVHSGMRSGLFFGSIIEGQTVAGGVAEVTSDHCIRIDSRQLHQLDEDVAMALVAHELAHDHLRHFKVWENALENEYQADNLARRWGFDVDRFRKICGPPSINGRLMQIHS